VAWSNTNKRLPPTVPWGIGENREQGPFWIKPAGILPRRRRGYGLAGLPPLPKTRLAAATMMNTSSADMSGNLSCNAR